jgi:DNA-binding ferritin-like protein
MNEEQSPSNRASGTDPVEVDGETVRRTEEIRVEIEQTREEMAETIDAIQERLRPRNIVANATERVKAATKEGARAMADYASDTAENVMNRTRYSAGGFVHTIRENPIPAALVGVGAAWLMTNASRARRENDWRGRYDRSRWARGESVYGAGGQYGERQYTEGGYGEGSTTGGIRQQVSEMGSELTSRAREYADETSEAIRRTSRRAQNQFQRMMNDSPLLVGAGALLLGVAFGLAVPETERENEWMGEARDSVVDRAQELASEAAATIQEKASRVADAAGSIAESASNKERG